VIGKYNLLKALITRFFILFLGIGLSLTFCRQTNKVADNNRVRLTVVCHDNQNPNWEFKTDTLLKDSLLDLTKTKIDLYFSHALCHYPYYMPTKSFFKNPSQEKECNWKIYPNTVKCYEYDSLNRVTRMQVEGSGTRGYWYYKYDSLNRVVELKREIDTVIMTYNSNGTLSEIKDDGGEFHKQFYFYYVMDSGDEK